MTQSCLRPYSPFKWDSKYLLYLVCLFSTEKGKVNHATVGDGRAMHIWHFFKYDKMCMKCIILIIVDSSVVSGLLTWLHNCHPRLSLELISLCLTLKHIYSVLYSAVSMWALVAALLWATLCNSHVLKFYTTSPVLEAGQPTPVSPVLAFGPQNLSSLEKRQGWG